MKKLGFGLMRLPVINTDSNEIDLERLKVMVDRFIEEGFIYFDTAYPYHGGKSEGAFKEAVVKRYDRNKYIVADKMPIFNVKEESELPKYFNEQLEKCGVEYFDYYLLHALGERTYLLSEEVNAFQFIKKMKDENKIKKIGFSFHDNAEVLDKILTNHPELDFVQLQINYLDWEDDIVQSRKCYEVATKHGIDIIIMEPIKGGSLANIPVEAENILKKYNDKDSIASWAIRYSASFENVIMVLSGMSTEEQLEDNMSYMKEFKPLNNEEAEILLNVTKVIKDSVTIPCTACNYCIEGCPKNIAISDYFKIYNDLKRFKDLRKNDAINKYNKLAEKFGKASSCIECRKCEKHCPQHIEIVDSLKAIASDLE